MVEVMNEMARMAGIGGYFVAFVLAPVVSLTLKSSIFNCLPSHSAVLTTSYWHF